jgi:hypothetical protein
VADTERDIKHQVWLPVDHIEELLEVTCPNHMYPIKHKLKECTMMKNYMTTGTFAKSKKPEGDSARKVAAPFLEQNAVLSIYGGPAPHESRHRLKLIGWLINSMSAAVLEYMRWSESLITFDHLDSIPKPWWFPLIIDPLVGTTRLTKALMDGRSGLNLKYLNTFEGLGLT